MFEADMEKYYVILKKDAVPVSSQDGDGYALDLEIYDSEWKKVSDKNRLPYVDEKRIYKDQLKAGSKWKATFIPDMENGIIKLKPI
jgi:hypothetical protein